MIMRKGKELDYWETLDRDADQMVEEITQKCLAGKLTVDQMWKEIYSINYICSEADICSETINKIFDFIEDNNLMSEEDAIKSYQENYKYDSDERIKIMKRELFEKYNIETDRDLIKQLGIKEEDKEKLFYWIKYQCEYSYRDGYNIGQDELRYKLADFLGIYEEQ